MYFVDFQISLHTMYISHNILYMKYNDWKTWFNVYFTVCIYTGNLNSLDCTYAFLCVILSDWYIVKKKKKKKKRISDCHLFLKMM